MRRFLLLFALLAFLPATSRAVDCGANDFLTNPSCTVYGAKVTLDPIPGGASATNYWLAIDANTLANATYVLRDEALTARNDITTLNDRIASLEAAVAALEGGSSGGGVQAPTCTSMTPTSGAVGTTVVLAGTSFATTNSVTFNGLAASRTIISDARVDAIVPASATSGTVTLTNAANSVSCGTFTVTSGVPGAPPSVVATVDSSTQITVSWGAASGSPTGYTLEWTTDVGGVPGTWAVRGSTPSTQLFYTLISLTPNTKYWFRVKATNASGDGPYSSNATATTVSNEYPPDQAYSSFVQLTQPTVSTAPTYGGAGITNVFGTLGTDYNTTTKRLETRHHYTKTQPWSKNGTYMLMCTDFNTCQSTNDSRIYNGTTYAFIRTTNIPGAGHRVWSNVDDTYGYSGGTAGWYKWFAAGGTATTIKSWVAADFGVGSITSVSFANSEGGIDNNDTAAAMVVNSTIPAVITPSTGVMRCKVTGGGDYGATVSDATVSQDGAYLIVNYNPGGLDFYSIDDDGVCDFVRSSGSTSTGHHDACVDTTGAQVSVQATSSSLRKVNIETGTVTTIFANNNSRWHISCRNTDLPGWIYVSMDNRTFDATQTSVNNKTLHRIVAVKLDGSVVRNFAWDHSPEPTTYEQEPSVVPNRNGTLVVWKGDWNTGTDSVGWIAGKNP